MSLTNNDTLLQVNNLKKYFPTPHGLLYAIRLVLLANLAAENQRLAVPYLDYMSQRQVKSFSKARIFFHLIMRK